MLFRSIAAYGTERVRYLPLGGRELAFNLEKFSKVTRKAAKAEKIGKSELIF